MRSISELPEKALKRFPRIHFRKGLPPELPYLVRELIRYALLHDFMHTKKHLSVKRANLVERKLRARAFVIKDPFVANHDPYRAGLPSRQARKLEARARYRAAETEYRCRANDGRRPRCVSGEGFSL